MSLFKPYGAYKDSDTPWLDKIPQHWEMRKIKFATTFVKDRTTDVVLGSTYIGLEDVESGSGVYSPTPTESRSTEDGSVGVFAKGDTLYGKLRPYLRKAIIAPFDGVCSTEFLVLRPKDEIRAEWMWHMLLTSEVTQQIEAGCEGAKMPRADWDHVGSIRIPVAPKDEQAAILSMVAVETTRIDTLIEKKTLFIDLLKQKRQAIIIQAITKGLDPNVKMRDSGIEWIGSVPQHWGVPQLRRVIRSVEQGWSPDCHPGQAGDEEWGILKAGCVNNGEYRESENKALPPSLDARPEYEVHCGDILMSRASGTPAFVGSVALVGATRPKLMLSDKIFRIRLESNVCPRFFVTALGSRILRLQIENELSGGNGLANNLPQSALMEFVMPLPPVGEQEAISEHLALMTANLDLLVDRTKLSITLLRERRTALITAAVTGQIDLREDIA